MLKTARGQLLTDFVNGFEWESFVPLCPNEQKVCSHFFWRRKSVLVTLIYIQKRRHHMAAFGGDLVGHTTS